VNEEHALISFESHAKSCETCGDIDRLYLEGRDLCKDGYELAQTVLFHMNMQSDMEVYTRPDSKGRSDKLEVPPDMFPISLGLLATVENSYKDENRSRPFVTLNRPYAAIVQDQRHNLTPRGDMEQDVEGKVSDEPEPKKARARVFVRSDLEGDVPSWDAITPQECQIRVYPDKVDIHENPIYVGFSPPTMSVELDHRTSVQRHKTTPEVVLSGCRRLKQSEIQTEGDILFRCRSDTECNSLLRMIRRAIEGLQAVHDAEGQQEASEVHVKPTSTTSNEYVKWNQRLHDIREELASTKRASGGLSDLQFKMERLSTAVSGLDTANNPQDNDALKLYDTSRSPLATRILVCLTADLKSRPGSYIGLKTDRIVSELGVNQVEARMALHELVLEGEIHNTVDVDTWVVTHPPNDLPVLSEEQLDASTSTSDNKEDMTTGEAVYRIVDMGFSADEARAALKISDSGDGWDLNKALESLLSGGDKPSGEPLDTNTQDNSTMVAKEADHPTEEGLARTKASDATDYQWNQGLLEIRDELAFTKKVRGGRLSNLKSKVRQALRASRSTKEDHDKLDDSSQHIERVEAQDKPTDTDSTNPEQPNDPTPSKILSLSPEAEKVHTYLLNYTFAPPDGAHHILDIAAAVYLTREEVRQALSELKDLGMANVSGKNGWWWATKVEDTNTPTLPSVPAQATIVDTPSFSDTPPSPTATSSESNRLHLDTLNIDDFFSYASPSGARWTRVDRRLIDPRVLIAADEEFEDVGDSLVVHRVLRRGEIRRWAEESLRVRQGEGEIGGSMEGRGKGKGRRDERDEYQERLDRVIAGDMQEEEMRHFEGDGEHDGRFI
jgi:hypothetical protein